MPKIAKRATLFKEYEATPKMPKSQKEQL